jgi:hypothetical protein
MMTSFFLFHFLHHTVLFTCDAILLLYKTFYFLFVDNFRKLNSHSSECLDYSHLDCQQTRIGSFCFSRKRHFSG